MIKKNIREVTNFQMETTKNRNNNAKIHDFNETARDVSKTTFLTYAKYKKPSQKVLKQKPVEGRSIY